MYGHSFIETQSLGGGNQYHSLHSFSVHYVIFARTTICLVQVAIYCIRSTEPCECLLYSQTPHEFRKALDDAAYEILHPVLREEQYRE